MIVLKYDGARLGVNFDKLIGGHTLPRLRDCASESRASSVTGMSKKLRVVLFDKNPTSPPSPSSGGVENMRMRHSDHYRDWSSGAGSPKYCNNRLQLLDRFVF